jgi:predicted membrane protein
MGDWKNKHITYYLLHMLIAISFLFVGFKMTTMKNKKERNEKRN